MSTFYISQKVGIGAIIAILSGVLGISIALMKLWKESSKSSYTLKVYCRTIGALEIQKIIGKYTTCIFISLIIVMFRKRDSGISVVQKNATQSERFLTTTIMLEKTLATGGY